MRKKSKLTIAFFYRKREKLFFYLFFSSSKGDDWDFLKNYEIQKDSVMDHFQMNDDINSIEN